MALYFTFSRDVPILKSFPTGLPKISIVAPMVALLLQRVAAGAELSRLQKRKEKTKNRTTKLLFFFSQYENHPSK